MNPYLEQLFSLDGRVALVSGASRGIGAGLAQALARAGAETVGFARSAATEAAGFEYRQCDVRSAEAFSKLCEELFQRCGRLNILVNAAGVSIPSQGAQQAHEFEETLASNLTAAYSCCRVAAPYMKRSGGGTIINVTSIGSELGFPGNPGYVAAKGGLRLMTKALAIDLAADKIRVNNLAPGYIRTAMTDASFRDPARNRERADRTMLGRWGTADDLAGAAVFLASDASAYVTGIDLFVDGGWTAKGL